MKLKKITRRSFLTKSASIGLGCSLISNTKFSQNIVQFKFFKGIIAVVLTIFSVSLYAQFSDETKNMYPEKQEVLNYLDQPEIIEKYGKISDAVWSYAELGLQEFKSAGLLSKTLEEEGFTIEMGLAGMPTCFIAAYGTGKPVIGILMEFDALPALSQKGRVPYKDPLIPGAPGHGCGHNMMGAASAAAAIAVKKAMELYNIQGTIKVFGSPAEEITVSRPYMIRAGLFNEVDVVIDNHSSSAFSTSYGISGNALYSTIFTFSGISAHSGGSPWRGRSALDAVEIMNVATNYLREHLHYTQRMHYVILEGGEAPNVVPDKASVWYYVRNTDERVKEMHERVINCARAAALATDTELDIRCLTAIHQRHANKLLAELLQRNMEIVGMPEWTEEEHEFAKEIQKNLVVEEKGMLRKVTSLKEPPGIFVGGSSSDIGEVTLIAPTATLRFPGRVPGAISHHWSTVSATYGSAAWKGLNAGAKAIAASAIDLLTQPDELKKIRLEFEEYSKNHPYESFLPEDAVPPLDLNKKLMEKWRHLMEEHYIE
jgi:aminobenzoyl-glutamate utilization protein B